MSDELNIHLPEKIAMAFSIERGSVFYRSFYGGRGSGKSQGCAKVSALMASNERLKVACIRKFQNSIKESFYAEVKTAIKTNEYFESVYDVGVDYIRCKNGSEFIFKGINNNPDSIKSLANIDIWIIEEAEELDEIAWQTLLPTVRGDKVEVWVIFNPKKKKSPCWKRFGDDSELEGLIKCPVNYSDNPFFPINLEMQRKHDEKTMSKELYEHIWLGKFLERSAEQILASNVIIREFEKDFEEEFNGIDFGFSTDPLVKITVAIKGNSLYFYNERASTKVSINDTKEFIQLDDSLTYADSARPEMVSHLADNELYVEGCYKFKNSIKDGIMFLQRFDEIVIHPECKLASVEAMEYSWETDRFTGEILNEPKDENNNSIDAARYALQDKILEHNCIFDRSKLVKVKDARIYEINEAKHLEWYHPIIKKDGRIFQLSISIHKVTRVVMIHKESLTLSRQRLDASNYYSDDMCPKKNKYLITSDETGEELNESLNRIKNIYATIVEYNPEYVIEKIRLILGHSKLHVDKSCKHTIRHFLSYQNRNGKPLEARNEFIKCIGISLIHSAYGGLDGLTPNDKYDEEDLRSAPFVQDTANYQEDIDEQEFLQDDELIDYSSGF